MASPESSAITTLYKSWTERIATHPDMELVSLREMSEAWTTLASEPLDVSYADVEAAAVSGIWCIPPNAPEERAILFVHGGAFVLGSVNAYRKLAGHLARAVGIRVLLFEYRKAPEHPHPAQLEDTLAAYRWLLSGGFNSHHLAVAGDSAGAFLATMAAVQLAKDDTHVPAAIVSISPWYDTALTGETFQTNAHLDVLVGHDVMQMFSQLFRGDVPADDPGVNVLAADVTGLPPTYIVVGGDETLLDDATRFTAKAQACGVDVTLVVEPGMQHVFPFMAGRAPEANDAITAIATWLRPHLNITLSAATAATRDHAGRVTRLCDEER